MMGRDNFLVPSKTQRDEAVRRQDACVKEKLLLQRAKLRDRFAIAALAGMDIPSGGYSVEDKNRGLPDKQCAYIAEQAYRMANAMLKARLAIK